LGYLGFRVTASPPQTPAERHRLEVWFLIIAAVGIAAVVITGYRSSSVQSATQTALARILSVLERNPTVASRAFETPSSKVEPYSAATMLDGASNADFVALVNRRMQDLRNLERDYQSQLTQLILSPPGDQVGFQNAAKRKQEIESEEEEKFKTLLPELRELYNSLLKRRREPYLGCANISLAVMICGQIHTTTENPITSGANYFDALARGLLQ
jgi:hypothetical protein